MPRISFHEESLLMQRIAWITAVCFLYATGVIAQKIAPPLNDTGYYTTYHKDIIARIFLSQKYTAFEIKNGDAPRIRYRPNTNLNAGIGATYNVLSINLAYGFDFMNRDTKKGKTKSIDLQSRLYSRKWAIDVFGQFYTGYYLYPEGKSALPGNYYTRPDLHIKLAGISVYKILNFSKFTLRQPFMQDEWQKRSAGSFTAGAEVYYGEVSGDSVLVPSGLTLFYGNNNMHKLRIMKIGPGAGYAYTLVLPLHFYISGSCTFTINLAHVKETAPAGSQGKVGVNADMMYRFATGYHNGNWSANVFWINNRGIARGETGNRYVLNTGNYRLIIAKRLQPGIKTKKFLKVIDKIL